ncbi:AB-hydrolase YheT [Cryphonectria parasitica EP155]|uniref:alcohol O-acetyltransferase n=1 Tax=Cryphonectria parasitica (strain ATCC 38755 / EP155) TaxID=660469 RepID=A0A9P4YC12_CRYP1|nr:AB-hydrolase YheT [Cryphonectria parasitica EP155]KAF3770769.1 AB-hydrolase YheT [Cryphonectria parasitica EP155]
MDWFGHAKIKFTNHVSPLSLRSKDGSQTDLLKVCEKSTPPCQLNPLLFNGHLQTMWTAVGKAAPHIYYRRQIFESNHANYTGTFAVDFTMPAHQDHDDKLPPRTAYFKDGHFEAMGSDDSRPMLIVLHGLSGGSYEIYLRHCIAPLVLDNGGWDSCVVNARGCANSEVTSGVLFNARATWDVRQVVRWAKKTFPNRPLFGLGFSLGANIMTNFVGEEGSDCLLSAAVVVGNPFNLEVANVQLQNSLLGKEVYQRVMGGSCRELVLRHKDSISKFTKLDFEAIQKVTYLFEFDREVQTVCWGYPTENAYYRDASSSDSVLAIRIPYLAIQAADDPIAVEAAVPYEEFKVNPYTVCLTTSLGGHLAYFEAGGGRWHAKPVANFLRNMANIVDLKSINHQANGDTVLEPQYNSKFDPIRRKMQVDIAE